MSSAVSVMTSIVRMYKPVSDFNVIQKRDSLICITSGVVNHSNQKNHFIIIVKNHSRFLRIKFRKIMIKRNKTFVPLHPI